MIRCNPKYSNICWNRIGMYREDACYSCKMLNECDKLYDEKTGTFDYPKQDNFSPVGYRPKLVITEGGVYDREFC